MPQINGLARLMQAIASRMRPEFDASGFGVCSTAHSFQGMDAVQARVERAASVEGAGDEARPPEPDGVDAPVRLGAASPRTRFDKVMSDPVPIPEAGIEAALGVLRTNRPFRYGEDTAGEGEVARLEAEFAARLGRQYCAALNSCGASLFVALKALGVMPGEPVLCNAFTLAPVPGAIAHAAARPVMVDITDRLTIDLDDLRSKIAQSGAKALLLSQMRGHLPELPELMALCREQGVQVVEDCAHTLGARFDGRPAGSFGDVACFSAQTFKHLNAGEGGLLVTDDDEVAARAILMSGSYMMYAQNGARPPLDAFERWRDATPNFSMRMTEVTAALLRPQLVELAQNVERWNERYRCLETALGTIEGITTIRRDPREDYVGSSIQFLVEADAPTIAAFVEDCARHGVFLKWFGADRTVGFTSRYDQWGYAGPQPALARARSILARLIDMRVPLSLTLRDCDTIATVIAEAHAACRSRGDRSRTIGANPAEHHDESRDDAQDERAIGGQRS